jgi:hypothetical protein
MVWHGMVWCGVVWCGMLCSSELSLLPRGQRACSGMAYMCSAPLCTLWSQLLKHNPQGPQSSTMAAPDRNAGLCMPTNSTHLFQRGCHPWHGRRLPHLPHLHTCTDKAVGGGGIHPEPKDACVRPRPHNLNLSDCKEQGQGDRHLAWGTRMHLTNLSDCACSRPKATGIGITYWCASE